MTLEKNELAWIRFAAHVGGRRIPMADDRFLGPFAQLERRGLVRCIPLDRDFYRVHPTQAGWRALQDWKAVLDASAA